MSDALHLHAPSHVLPSMVHMDDAVGPNCAARSLNTEIEQDVAAPLRGTSYSIGEQDDYHPAVP
jgi:hypothetical protein